MHITRQQIKATLNTHIYVYADAHYRTAIVDASQAAECAGESNCFRITTKWKCCTDHTSYVTDDMFDVIRDIWHRELENIRLNKKNRLVIILPNLGITHAMLPTKAPKCWAWLQEQLKNL